MITKIIVLTTTINAAPSSVWEALINPARIRQWMAEPEMEFEMITNWKVGTPIIIRGYHHTPFENKGIVLQFETNKVLTYNYLSSLSRLPDKPENYTTVEFQLSAPDNQTSLTVTLSNFPTEAIFKHVDFYWKTTIQIMKTVIERNY